MTPRTFTLDQALNNECPFCGLRLDRFPGLNHPRYGVAVDFTKQKGEQADVLFVCQEPEEEQ